MKNQPFRSVRHPGPAGEKRGLRSALVFILALIAACGMVLCSCGEMGEPIDKPDEFTHIYQASEKHILRAIYETFKDKDMGRAVINEETQEVSSEYIVHGEWRTRSLARIIKVNRNEREVVLSIITEKKTPVGWEMRRLLGKGHYERIFDAIDTQIYREMSRPD